MAEIKLNDSFSTEVEALRASGEAIKDLSVNVFPSSDISLPTVNAYQNRLDRIWLTVLRFSYLVNKDADDMDALAARLKAADLNGGGGSR